MDTSLVAGLKEAEVTCQCNTPMVSSMCIQTKAHPHTRKPHLRGDIDAEVELASRVRAAHSGFIVDRYHHTCLVRLYRNGEVGSRNSVHVRSATTIEELVHIGNVLEVARINFEEVRDATDVVTQLQVVPNLAGVAPVVAVGHTNLADSRLVEPRLADVAERRMYIPRGCLAGRGNGDLQQARQAPGQQRISAPCRCAE